MLFDDEESGEHGPTNHPVINPIIREAVHLGQLNEAHPIVVPTHKHHNPSAVHNQQPLGDVFGL